MTTRKYHSRITAGQPINLQGEEKLTRIEKIKSGCVTAFVIFLWGYNILIIIQTLLKGKL